MEKKLMQKPKIKMQNDKEKCKMSKCLVTGGAGFIGSTLVDELIKQNNEVVIVDDLSSGKKEYLNSNAKFYNIDICSLEIADIFAKEKFELVFHLAAQIDVRKSVQDPVFDNKVNALGSLNIFENSHKAGVKKVIFASTGGAIYGDCETLAAEDALARPLSPYAIHKYAAERYLDFYKDVHGLENVSLRLANVYGHRQYKGGEGAVVAVFTHNALNKQESIVNGDGLQTRDFVYVQDVVRAFVMAAENDCEGVFNIGASCETNILELIKTIEKATGEKFSYKHGQEKKGEVRKSVLDNKKAREVLGWSPQVNLEEGIERTLGSENVEARYQDKH